MNMVDLQGFISTISDIKDCVPAKKEQFIRRAIFFPVTIDSPVLLTRIQTTQDNDTTIQDTFSIILNDINLECQITISDLMLIYDTLSNEISSYQRLNSSDKRLNTSTVLDMSLSKVYKAPTFTYMPTNLIVNMRSFGLQMVRHPHFLITSVF